MRARCRNRNHRSWKNYGGRGITFDDRFDSFEAFLAAAGHRRPGTSLDRINVNGPYAPQNIRWASAKVQANNRRRRRIRPGAVATFVDLVEARALLWIIGELSLQEAVDGLWVEAERNGLVTALGPDQVQQFLADGFALAGRRP